MDEHSTPFKPTIIPVIERFSILDRTAKPTHKGIIFNCLACKDIHYIYTEGDNVPLWSWNGDLEKPTITPWIKTSIVTEEDKENKICHCMIANGNITFLGDSHRLANRMELLTKFK